jgi:prepilin-type N-terminal cleavage/methylation domain-containing protein
MKFKNTNTNAGFTIVELLIVIVVIGILAAITFVAFNGITARTNANASQVAASTVTKKAEAYNAEKGRYPITTAELTGAAPSDSWYIPTTQVTFNSGTISSAPANNKTVQFLKCAAATAADQSSVTASNITGVRVLYWNHPTGATSAVDTGNTTSCPTS